MTDFRLDNAHARRPSEETDAASPRASGEDRTWRLACVGGMAAIMAHRLAQPVTAINALVSSSIKAARDPAGDRGKLAENLARIEQQAHRVTDMVRGFAQFAHHGAPDIGATDTQAALVAALAPFDQDIKRFCISLQMADAAGLPHMAAEPVVVEQIISCLVRNAIDAVAGGGGGRREIAIAASCTEDGMIEIAVADTGPGIAPDVAEVLFDPFAPERPVECGVGLAVSRAMVEALGGRIGVKSSDGGGAVVAFALPVAR